MTKEKVTKHATSQYLGEEFYIDERWKFYVVFLDRSYDTYQQMGEAIERAQKTEAAKKKTKINVEFIGKNGERFDVTGVHAGHGHIITKQKFSRYDTPREGYPVVPWIADGMKNVAQLKAQAEHVQAAIDCYCISLPGHYSYKQGKYASPEEFVEGEELRLRQLAEATNLQQQLLETDPPTEIEFD